MIQIQFGNFIISTAEESRPQWEDLGNAPTNTFLATAIAAQGERVSAKIREALSNNDLGKARELDGYVTALENVVDFIIKGIDEGLKEKDEKKI